MTDAAILAPPPIDDWDAAVSDFDKLRTPDSPAFVILGVSPTEIQRPTTPQGLIAVLGGAVADGDLQVPKNFALEVAPYWLFAHRDLSVEDYRGQAGARLYRTLSFSVGTNQTTRTDIAGDHTDSDIGLGFRTMLFQAGGEDECTAKAREYGFLKSGQAVLTRTQMVQLAALAKVHPVGSKEYDEALRSMLESNLKPEVQQAAKDNLKRLDSSDKCVALVASTTGFQVDLAGALDIRATDSKLTRSATTLAGYALWANASYDASNFSGVLMARLASHDLEMGTERAFDSGLRGIYKGKTFALSAEALLRYRLTHAPERTTTKVDIGLEYELTSETWLSLTFGKDFTFAPGDAAALFSLANLKWGFVKSSHGNKS